jgi:hypothetical protein
MFVAEMAIVRICTWRFVCVCVGGGGRRNISIQLRIEIIHIQQGPIDSHAWVCLPAAVINVEKGIMWSWRAVIQDTVRSPKQENVCVVSGIFGCLMTLPARGYAVFVGVMIEECRI